MVRNLEISDILPKGLEYVAGSLKVDGQSVTDSKDGDKGHFVDGVVYGQFGNVKDTNWHTVEFQAKVKTGQAGTSIKNIANVNGDNIDRPDKPETEVTIYPQNPVLESEKTAKNVKEGKEKYEVGDTVLYTIKTRNKVANSLVENLTIIDKLPEGLSFVEGSLKVSHKGTGQYKDGKVTASFGNVADTEWRTVTFEVKIKSGQSGKKIKNIAIIDGNNVKVPQNPEEELVVDNHNPTDDNNPNSSDDDYDANDNNPNSSDNDHNTNNVPNSSNNNHNTNDNKHTSSDSQNSNTTNNQDQSSPSKDNELSLPKTGDTNDYYVVTAGILLLLVSAFSIVFANRRKYNR